MHYYETVHYNTGDEFPTTTAHDTLEQAIEFANAHGIGTIYEIGGSWGEFGKCFFCNEWVDLCALDHENICSDCRRAIEEHNGAADPMREV